MSNEQEIEIYQVQHAALRQGDAVGILCCCGMHNETINSVEAEKEFASTLTKEQIAEYFKENIRYMFFTRRTDDYVFVLNLSKQEEKHSMSCVKIVVTEEQE